MTQTQPGARTPQPPDPRTPQPPDPRTPQQIEADLAATRARLTGRIEQLEAYVKPKAILDRQLAKAKGFYIDPYGGVRPERVLATAGAVAVVVGLFVLRRRRRR